LVRLLLLRRRVVAAGDIPLDSTALSCTLTFNVTSSGPSDDQSDSQDDYPLHGRSDVPQFDFVWNTSAIRIVNATGQ